MAISNVEKLREKIKQFPSSPGVYLMKNDKCIVIYVGKAASLNDRVRSYFSGQEERCQIKFLMKRVVSIEIIVTDTEKEALILEDILIKKHSPRYNINLKDDKTYLSVKVDMKLDFPRLEVVRIKKKENKRGVRYFGPYSSAQALRETLALIHRIFFLRTCRESNFNNRTRPCLSYQIDRCSGPCCGNIAREDYQMMIGEVLLFLEGKSGEIVGRFRKRMKEAAGDLNFEEAARLRDCIINIKKTVEKQRVFSSASDDRDVIAYYREGADIAIYVMSIRAGKVTEGKSFIFSRQEMPDAELISSFIKSYYSSGRYVPTEIIIPGAMDDLETVREWLGDMRGKKVLITSPKRGDKVKLLALAGRNAKQAFITRVEDKKEGSELLSEIRQTFGLNRIPARMECFDISNIQGTDAVGSMVAFTNGKADKDKYRRFKIKSVAGIDDFAMMYEVLSRRLKRGVEEGDLPELIVVDGGKGQLGVAMRAIEDAGIEGQIDLLALAKEKNFKSKDGVEKREERVYVPGRKNPVKLKARTSMLFLFQRIRDEAHRFAITYHKKKRAAKALSSPLDKISGIGPVKKKELIRKFGSVKRIKEAAVGELSSVRGITPEVAKRIKTILSHQ